MSFRMVTPDNQPQVRGPTRAGLMLQDARLSAHDAHATKSSSETCRSRPAASRKFVAVPIDDEGRPAIEPNERFRREQERGAGTDLGVWSVTRHASRATIWITVATV